MYSERNGEHDEMPFSAMLPNMACYPGSQAAGHRKTLETADTLGKVHGGTESMTNRLFNRLAPCMAAMIIALAGAAANGQCPKCSCLQGITNKITGKSYVGDVPASEVCSCNAHPSGTDLFYNYYTQGGVNQTNAQMYLSPGPIPPNVGHTFYTYQPFYPHELMYSHKNRFHNYYDNGRGINRTRAVYYSPPVRTAISNLYWNCLRLPR
jgi:hypothetical protein